MNINSRYIYYSAIIILIIIIIYKLYSDTSLNLEHFGSNINNFKKKQSRKSNNILNNKLNNKFNNKFNNKYKKKLNNKIKNNNGVTFDDIISESEAMNVDKYALSNVKEDFWSYVNSFKSEKFKNVTGTTNESLEKLYLFRDKFFEIFQ